MVGSRLFTALNQQSLNSDDDTGGAVNQRVFDLFNRSAELGNPDAHQILGTLYSTGAWGASGRCPCTLALSRPWVKTSGQP